MREPVEQALDRLVADDIIVPVETSDWATPIVPVVKHDGTIRVCGDFKLTLNKCLEVDRFPLPKVEDLLAKLGGGVHFAKLDLSQAYAQFVLDEESQKYTVINTHRGLFKYKRLIYGLSSSPGIFQRKLEQMFADMPRVGVFLDDVIISARNEKEYMDTLYAVLERLQRYGLKVKKEKCSFAEESVEYLGYIIDKEGIRTNPAKLEAIREVDPPTTTTELRAFIGMVMYYGKFIKNVSTILSPLYALLRKGAMYVWSQECEEAFCTVKELLASSEVLAHYSLDLPIILTTDASSVGVGAVISHVMEDGSERPIAYASRVLNSSERGYSQIDKEALAIIYAVKKFHQYLYGRKFLLRTDHRPLVSIFGPKSGIPTMAASRMQRWAVILSGYDYDIEYVSTSRNSADALSRLPKGTEEPGDQEVTYINFINDFLPITQDQVKEEIKRDKQLCKIYMYVQSGWPAHCMDTDEQPYHTRKNELYLDDGCIMWGYRMLIPPLFRKRILQELHVGHMGMVKMKSLARSYVWWPGIDADIESTCKECLTCVVEAAAPPRAPPQPWTYHPEPWSRLHMDFLGPYAGKMFLIIIDSTSKWIEAFHMTSTTATAVIKVLRETLARFGLPKEIVSDNGPPFTSTQVREFMEHNGIKHTFTPAYHPASNGAAEGAVKLCKKAIKKAVREGRDMDTALQAYLLAYRNSVHNTTGETPARLLQRRGLRSRLDLLRSGGKVEARVIQQQQQQVKEAGGQLRNFEVGETVWIRNYGDGEKWRQGKIETLIGNRNFGIKGEDGTIIKRHVDQIRRRPPHSLLAYPGTIGTMGGQSLSPAGVPRQSQRTRRPVERFGNPVTY